MPKSNKWSMSVWLGAWQCVMCICSSLTGLTLTITLPTMVGLIGLFLPSALVWEGGGDGMGWDGRGGGDRRGGGGACVKNPYWSSIRWFKDVFFFFFFFLISFTLECTRAHICLLHWWMCCDLLHALAAPATPISSLPRCPLFGPITHTGEASCGAELSSVLLQRRSLILGTLDDPCVIMRLPGISASPAYFPFNLWHNRGSIIADSETHLHHRLNEICASKSTTTRTS